MIPKSQSTFVLLMCAFAVTTHGQNSLNFPDVALCDGLSDLTIDLPTFVDLSAEELPYEALTGNELFVSTSGNNTSGDGTPANPYLTIQHGISQATDGMIVTVMDGTYSGPENTGLSPQGKTITIQSQNGPLSTVIDGEFSAQGFVVNSGETLNTMIRGFSIVNTIDITGNSQSAAIFVEDNSGIGITHCIFRQNESCIRFGNTEVSGPQSFVESCAFVENSGFAISASKKSFYTHDCVFARNTIAAGAVSGNGHVANPAQEYRNCVYSCNTQAAHLGHGKRMENSLFIHNNTPNGTMYTGTNWSGMNTIDHCTFAFNTCNYYSSGWWDHMGDVRSSIFFPGAARDHVSGNQSVIDYYNSLGDGISGDGNIQGDPLFVSPNDLDYSLGGGSPCIGTGENGSDMGVDMSQLEPWLFTFIGDSSVYDIIIDGEPITMAESFTFENITAGVHTVTYEGCDWSVTAEFTVTLSGSSVDAGPDLVICPNEQIALLASGADSYTWSGGWANGDFVAVEESSWFIVEGTGAGLCNAVDSFFVEVSTSNGDWGDWELLVPPSDLPSSWTTDDFLIDREAGKVFVKDWQAGYMASVDMETGTVDEIDVDGWMEFTEMVYGAATNKIYGWRAGTDDVYEVDAGGGTWTLVVDGNFDASHYGASSFWNPLTENVGFFGGYGFFTTHNAVFEPVGMNGGWQELIANSNDGNPPRMTGVPISPNASGDKILVYGWHGNSSGTQYQCELDIIWSNGNYCWSRGLWELDLNNHEFSTVLSLDASQINHLGDVAWDFNSGELVVVGGQLFPPNANNTDDGTWTNSVSTMSVADGTSFENLPSTGMPVLEEYGQVFFDGNQNCLIYLRSDGIWKSCKSSCIVPGCTDVTACNFDDEANEEDGSCAYPMSSDESVSACDEYTWNGQVITQSGIYTEEFEMTNGCDSIATLNLTLGASSFVTTSTTVCGGYSWNGSYIDQSGNYEQVLSTALGCDSVTTLDLVVYPTYESSITVATCTPNPEPITESLFTVNGCDSIVHTIEVPFENVPFATFQISPNPVVWPFDNVTCTNLSSNAFWVAWFVDGVFFSSEFEPDFSSLEVGTHTVTLEVESEEGCADSAVYELHVEEEIQVYVPNAFSPISGGQGDGVNDAFHPVLSSYEGVEDYEFAIFNRWGEQIWATNDPLEPWIGPAAEDGEYFAQDGSYLWTLKFHIAGTYQFHQHEGHVLVLR